MALYTREETIRGIVNRVVNAPSITVEQIAEAVDNAEHYIRPSDGEKMYESGTMHSIAIMLLSTAERDPDYVLSHMYQIKANAKSTITKDAVTGCIQAFARYLTANNVLYGVDRQQWLEAQKQANATSPDGSVILTTK